MMTVWVPGQPKTKGSMTARPNGSMRENVVGSKRWRMLMASKFRQEWAGREPLQLRVMVNCLWMLPVDPIAVRSGDIDKLVRNLLDALTDAAVYRDDVQVARLITEKVGPRPSPGVWVSVEELPRSWEHLG